jgi:hypothetical protein
MKRLVAKIKNNKNAEGPLVFPCLAWCWNDGVSEASSHTITEQCPNRLYHIADISTGKEGFCKYISPINTEDWAFEIPENAVRISPHTSNFKPRMLLVADSEPYHEGWGFIRLVTKVVEPLLSGFRPFITEYDFGWDWGYEAEEDDLQIFKIS